VSDLAEPKCVFLAIKLNTTSQGFLLQLAPPALADVKLNATSVLAQNFGWPLDTGLEIMDEDNRILAHSGLTSRIGKHSLRPVGRLEPRTRSLQSRLLWPLETGDGGSRIQARSS
jgi:hypothetical protein